MRKLINVIFAVALMGFASTAFAQDAPQDKAKSLDELLELVKRGAIDENKDNVRREREFVRQKSQQKSLLSKANSTRRQEERRSDRLDAEFKANDAKLAKLQDDLSHELGALKELFGVLQQVSGDAKAVFRDSIVSSQFPGREAFLTDLIEKTSSSSKLPTIAEIERLWFEIQRQMTETGKVVKFNVDVQAPDGAVTNKEVVRIGPFNLISEGKYLDWSPKFQTVTELVRQPDGRYLDDAADLQNTTDGFSGFGLDPSRGAILGLLIQAPSIMERIHQGSTIGYIIIFGLGPLSALLLIFTGLKLLATRNKVKAQIRSDVVSDNNPLGRVLSVYDSNKSVDVETLELKLDEAILKETPTLERFLTMIKIIAAIAPLMGLLGTVTGMINTFQSMTLFGTGDPKLMAGGISQALVTTVLGIVVALPTLFFHSIVAGWSRGIIHTLEEQSAGIIAVHAEQSNKGA